MMRPFAIVILAAYLISFTEFKEVLRLPLLIEHFGEHKSMVEEMSFVQFLVMHYKTDIPHDDQDMSLPFKDCNHSVSVPMVLPVLKMSLTEQLEINNRAFQSFYLQPEPKLLASDIFQPPRI